jgi:hypothetical protein
MKRIIFASLCFAVLPFASIAQKLAASQIPAVVRTTFYKVHPGAIAAWEPEGASYEANFKEAGKSMSVVIDKHGTILETETNVPLNELPAMAQVYIKQHFRGSKLQEISRIVKKNGAINYEVMINQKDVLFDAKGNRITK